MGDRSSEIAHKVKTGKMKIDAVEPQLKRHVSALVRNVPVDTLKAMAEKPVGVVKRHGFTFSKPHRVRST